MALAKPYKRARNLFAPESKKPFKLSRSKLENFLNCPRCFYLDRRLGVGQPSMPAFTLNSAVDSLLKAEFDDYRRRREPHPIMEQYGIKATPLAHPLMDEWRNNFKGVQYMHEPSNMLLFGAVDDIWITPSGQWHVVDYKSTSTDGEITLDSKYKEAFKRQMEIYQWLLRQNNFNVSDTGYFVYCNALKNRLSFDSKLDFAVEIIAYEGRSGWVEDALMRVKECLSSPKLPDPGGDCEYCLYREAASEFESFAQTSMEVQGELFQNP